jgi:hypothetical protein
MANDAMIRRHQKELEERNAYVQGIITIAQEAGRDLNETEMATIGDAEKRMREIDDQLGILHTTAQAAEAVQNRIRVVDQAITDSRDRAAGSSLEYRSAGAFAQDMYMAALGHRAPRQRLEIFERTAEHQTTVDSEGIVPSPIIGPVLNFIDTQRPIVSALGPRPLPGESWYRPHVTQHSSVAKQGTTGLAAAEKTELVSQRLKIERLSGVTNTYGGYVNVSKQFLDFSDPAGQGMQIVIDDLAGQYAIETEGAVCDALTAVGTSAVTYDDADQASLSAAIWAAVAAAFTAVQGMGNLFIGIAPDRLAAFGPLFAPYGPTNSSGQGFMASNFGHGVMGSISGVPVLMSSQFAATEAFLASTAAIEVYEQRVGALQVTEPSVLGVQVAYAGYFSTMTIVAGGIVPLEMSGS